MWFEFGYTEISNKNSVWGAFGSYLGGVLTPLFTLVSIFFIYYSIRINNENHKIEMTYLNEQQTLLNISSLAASINDKLNEKFIINDKSIKNKKIVIYSYSDDHVNGWISWENKNNIKVKFRTISFDEMNLSLTEILKNYSFFKRKDAAFSFEYTNALMIVSHDYFNAFKITLEYINKIKDKSLKDNALMILSTKVSNIPVMNLYHLLADHVRDDKDALGTRDELRSLEDFVVISLNASNETNSFNLLCVPLLTMFLEHSFYSLLVGEKYFEYFEINNNEKINLTINSKNSVKCDVTDFFNGERQPKAVMAIRSIFAYARLTRLGGKQLFPFEIKGEYIITDENNYFSIQINKLDKAALDDLFEAKASEYKFYFRLNGTKFNLMDVDIVEINE